MAYTLTKLPKIHPQICPDTVNIRNQTCQPLRSQKCILQLKKVYFSHKKCILQVSPKKTHIIQLLNTKTSYTTDVLVTR